MVEFVAWSNSHGVIGFREISVDGKAIIDVSGWASSGATDAISPHPLEKSLKSGT